MTRGLGYIPDPAGFTRAPFERLAELRELAAEGPSSHFVTGLPPVMDQGSGSEATSSCTGHAVAVMLAPALGWVPSPAGIYRNGRALDRASPRIRLADIGARPSKVFIGINEFGVVPMGRSVPGRYSDAHPSTINDEPKLDVVEVGLTNLVVGQYGIYAHGAARGAAVRRALAANIPLTAAIAGGSSVFQGYRGGVLSVLNAPLDHYVALIGYDRLNDGRYVYLVQNSWGTGWGELGDCWLSDAGLDELGDVVAGDIRRAA